MILFALGLGVLVFLLWSAGAFASAEVRTVKSFLAWIAALGGLLLGALLLLTGRGAMALSAAVLLGPLAWSWWRERDAAGKPSAGRRDGQQSGMRPGTRMTRAEALEILGLQAGADQEAIQSAWMEMIRRVHPDGGGSAWMAARVNEARDVLLKGR